jgi:glycosyltransferase involved in cell wall biosynthesis
MSAKISAVVTCFNSERTLGACLASLRWADEIIVLDSFSTDASHDIAKQYQAHWQQQAFKGYAKQKSDAVALARHDWVVLLDADEALDQTAETGIRAAIEHAVANPSSGIRGFRLARIERIFWRYAHPGTRHNRFLRVFDRRCFQMSTHVVHESPMIDGNVVNLDVSIWHDSELSIAIKADKLNHYSTLALQNGKAKRGLWWRLSFYPIWYFLRSYIGRRQFLNGWAGYINSVENAHYAFLKYAKQLESKQIPEPKKIDRG